MELAAQTTGNAYLPAPQPGQPFSSLTFTQGRMGIYLATMPCVGIQNQDSHFRIGPARYGDVVALIAALMALVSHKAAVEKNLGFVCVFQYDGDIVPPGDIRTFLSTFRGGLVWVPTHRGEQVLPAFMRPYEDYTCV